MPRRYTKKTGGSTPPEGKVSGDPAYSVVEFNLTQGQTITGGEGRMLYRRGNLSTNPRVGGIGKAIARWAANGPLVMNDFNGEEGGGTISFAGVSPGDMLQATVSSDMPLVISRGAFICSDKQVDVSAKLNLRGFFDVGQEEGWLLPKVFVPEGSAPGRVWLSSFGAFQKHVLKEGESLWVDNGSFLASNVMYKVDKAVQGGMWKAFLSGEGFAMRFEGPGVVYTQNRNFNEFAMLVGGILSRGEAAAEATGTVIGAIGDMFTGGESKVKRTTRKSSKSRSTVKK